MNFPEFSSILINWYKKNKRDLPWRHTSDPYKIWISEIILQQTRVDQGLSYYTKFTENFPTVAELALAPEERVMKLWQGLGYYSRARNLHATAKIIHGHLKGKFPTNYNDILQLKGVGVYTAAAIASFCFNEAKAVVDGNVYRVLSRIFGITTPIDSNQGKIQFMELATLLLPDKKAAIHNQAIMEFGAIQCVPRNPNCSICPFTGTCAAFSQNGVHQMPVKSKSIKVSNRYFEYFIFNSRGNTFIRQRQGNDIWKNLFEFPLFETDETLEECKILKSKQFKDFVGEQKFEVTSVSKVYKHVLSHRNIFARFWLVKLPQASSIESYEKVKLTNLELYAWPRLIDRYLHEAAIYNSKAVKNKHK